MPEIAKIQFRRGTAAQWAAANPVLDEGSPGFALDTNVLKVGDGTSRWSALPEVGGDELQAVLDGVTGKTGATVEEFVAVIRNYGAADISIMGAFQTLLDAIAGKDAATVQEIEQIFANGIGVGADVQPLLDLLALKPDATVADVEVVWQALSNTSSTVYQLVNILGGKQVTGDATIADVAAFFDNLPGEIQTLVAEAVAALATGPGGVDAAVVQAIVDLAVADKADKTDVQAVITALCAAPFDGMTATGAVADTVAEWVAVVKQEITQLDYTVRFLGTTKASNDSVALKADKTALNAIEGKIAANNEYATANIELLEAEDAALKKRLGDLEYTVRELSAGNSAGLVSQVAFDGFAQSIGGEINTLSNTVDALLAAGSGAGLIDGGTPFDDDGSPLAAAAAAGFNMDDLLKLLSGGKDVPRNVDWTVCQNLEGTGNVEARMINGVVQMRGTLTYTHTSASTSTIIGELPVGVQPPATDSNYTVWANETGVGQKIGAVRISTRGRISVSAPTGPFNSITFNSITYPAF